MQDGQTVDSNARRRFAAFISYAHADAAIAGKLQSRLERYRLPKHIAAAHADGKAALGQIFRDREDLAAAPSLSDAIRAAITKAEALIVLCSPDAQASRWVGEEIALFRSLHPDRPILAALVRGEPDETFPDSLTEGGNEPLAADLRKEGDGEALGFLKIVAGIAGVPLDTLVQRDAQRRIRRVMWITGGALAAMLVMGVMTTLALQARNEAARQRAEAEGLVEYMLTDLRQKLKGVGRLDIQSDVNRKMISHYARRENLSQLTPDSLQRRARVLHAMGEDFEKSGELESALKAFVNAEKMTSALLTADTQNPDYIFAHAQSEYWVGYGAFLNGDLATAEIQAAKYQQLAMQLSTVGKDKIAAKMELGWAANFWGVLKLYGRGQAKAALPYFNTYRATFEKIARERPGDTEALRSLSMSHALLAETLLLLGRQDEALKHRQLEQAIIKRLNDADPQNAQLWMLGIIRNRDIARILISKGDFRNARWYYQQAKEWGDKLISLDPTNSEWRLQNALNLTIELALNRNLLNGRANTTKTKLLFLMSDRQFLMSLRPPDREYFMARAEAAINQQGGH